MSGDLFDNRTDKPVRRKRHPIRAIVVTLIVLAALLIPGYFVAENLAETAARNYVQAGVQKELNVASQDDIHVNLGTGSIILQALQKNVKHLRVTIDSFATDDISGSAVFTASGVPLSTSDPVDSMAIALAVDPDSLQTLVRRQSGFSKATVTLVGGQVHIATTFSVLTAKVPLAVDLAPSAVDGNLVFTPTAIDLNKKKYTVKSLKASALGPLVGGLVKPRVQCVASSLPRALALKNVAVAGGKLVITVAGADASLDSLSTKGTCATS